MICKTIRNLVPSALLAASLLFAASPARALDPTGPSTTFNVTTPTAVPGLTLPAGSFSITVVDHLADRYIVRVADQAGDVVATFLGIPATQLTNRAASGMVLWNGSDSGPKRYIRGWAFPAQQVSMEFVYPKTEAVAIAQMNHARVAAIDPASDGLVVKSTLSKEDLQIVTLWLLSPTHVGPGDHKPGVSAARYQAPPAESTPLVAQQVARSSAPAVSPAPRQPFAQTQPVARTQPVQVAHLETPPAPNAGRRVVIARLPHTASNLGWVWLIGAFAILAATGLRLRRLA